MFSIAKSDSYTWPVAFEYPVAGGQRKKDTFDVEFRRIPQSRIRKLIEQASAGELEGDAALAKELILGWKGVVDGDGKEVPFSDSSLDMVLDVPGVGSAIVAAFFDSLQTGKRKN